MKSRAQLLWILLACSAQAHNATEAPKAAVAEIPMQAWSGYFVERCMQIDGGNTIRLSFASPHPFSFNIHYHTDRTTEYLANTVVHDDSEIRAVTPSAGEYCIEVKNDEARDAPFTVRMALAIDRT